MIAFFFLRGIDPGKHYFANRVTYSRGNCSMLNPLGINDLSLINT